MFCSALGDGFHTSKTTFATIGNFSSPVGAREFVSRVPFRFVLHSAPDSFCGQSDRLLQLYFC